MIIDHEKYIEELIKDLQNNLGERLLYVGLQGSYLRGEATENSDIDIMVVIDGMKVSDMDMYREAIGCLEQVEKSCGFIRFQQFIPKRRNTFLLSGRHLLQP